MKFFTTAFMFIIPICLWAQNITPTSQLVHNFQSAEERIVYNKKQQLPNKYEGVLIQYSYLLKEEAYQLGEKGLKALVNEKFKAIESIEFQKMGEQIYLQILTEGHRENHEKYNDLLYLHTQYLGRASRSYLLK